MECSYLLKRYMIIKKNFKKDIVCNYIIGCLVLVIGIISFLFWTSQKEVWFCDEIYTFESAHGMEQSWPAANTGQWIDREEMEAFFSANSDRLSLNWIRDTLYSDHVPLYFWLYRIVAFFCFKGSATLWTGYSINLIFYILFLGLAYIFWKKTTGNFMISAAIVLLSSIVNKIMIGQFTMLRMYMMLVFSEFILIIIGMKIFRLREKGVLDFTSYLLLLLASLLGFLVHYDYWVFYAITSFAFCVWLLLIAMKKEKKLFFKSIEFKCVLAWVGNFISSLILTMLIFPYCRWNLNRGKGQTALHSFFQFSGDKIETIIWGYRRLVAAIFGEHFSFELGIIIIAVFVTSAIILLYRKKEWNKLSVLCFMVIISLGYQMIICFTFPAGNEERYLWGTFTLFFMCFVWSVYLLLDAICKVIRKKSKTIVMTVVSVAFTVTLLVVQYNSIDKGNGVPYLRYPFKDVKVLESYEELPWIVYGNVEDVYSYYDWIIPEQICFFSQENTKEDLEALIELESVDTFILYTYPKYYSQALEFVEQGLGERYEKEYLMQSVNMDVYVIRK